MKLLRIEKSPRPEKKWRAVFESDSGQQKTTDFGSAGMDDYTITKDKEQRERYRSRHKKDLETGDPTRAGYLSYEILWGPYKSIQSNIQYYRQKYNL
jgi:hypothetical protein